MSIVEGPGIVDYEEWQQFYYATNQMIKTLSEPARSDVQRFFENTQAAWLEYSSKSLYYKKHNKHLYEKFLEAKKTTEKYITWAGLSGMTR